MSDPPGPVTSTALMGPSSTSETTNAHSEGPVHLVLNGVAMDEEVLPSVVRPDEAESLGAVEPTSLCPSIGSLPAPSDRSSRSRTRRRNPKEPPLVTPSPGRHITSERASETCEARGTPSQNADRRMG
ncbi:hypothetical protein BHE74_00032603 [Ensete ventricosum]|nr:hypothetical protein BHE74_00032603 [Ensete ventricosum]